MVNRPRNMPHFKLLEKSPGKAPNPDLFTSYDERLYDKLPCLPTSDRTKAPRTNC